MSQKAYQNLINKYSKLNILVAGDIILDRYLQGEVSRISPEAPVPVVRIIDTNYVLGGAANVAANLSSMGVKVKLFGLTGKDAGRDAACTLLKKCNVSARFVFTDKTRPTITKSRVLASNQQMLRLDREDTLAPDKLLTDRIIAALGKAIPRCDAIIVSDYAKGFLSKSILTFIIRQAKKYKKLVVVDPKGADFSRYSGVTTLTPNTKEAEVASGIKLTDEKSITKAGLKILSMVKCDFLTITLGEKGAAIIKPGASCQIIPSFRREVFDITGAGDTFISHYTMALVAGKSPSEAAHLANFAGSIVVGRHGVSTVTPEDLEPYFVGQSPAGKLKRRDELITLVKKLKSNGKTIVFANGVFDLLHVGHIKFLEHACELGDYLIVAINSDRSTRKIKPAPRPILSEDERAQIIGALSSVDYVTIFDNESALSLIKAIRPDILVKGKNLKISEVEGHQYVNKYGGKVVLLPFLGNLSTSDLLADLSNTTKKNKK